MGTLVPILTERAEWFSPFTACLKFFLSKHARLNNQAHGELSSTIKFNLGV